MALTPSNMLSLGTKAPDFSLIDTISDTIISLNESKGINGTVIMFICNHCPFVKHVNEGIVQLANDYISKGIGFIAISSNDVENYPADAPHLMKANAEEFNFSFPYLYDKTQEVAKAYDAACTPDFYIFDAELALVYRGQLDDSRPNNGIPVTGNDMRTALDALLKNEKISEFQKPSIGCNIKWF
ncbi:thioredoxin family protein [Kordia sp.]|uniref:thioredoxin family protein n=1 Tax=Kordia sp. TaxID=1965332 RepID=UPI0025BAE48A|nr:thioredoxin family protein [Kordia sp.]MCH2195609.1 thioredoxin family protein [Kordia sp.]